MGLKHKLARAFVTCLPTDTGLWRLKRFLPNAPNAERLTTRKLRGYPLVMKFRPGTYCGWYLYYRGMYEERSVQVCVQMLRNGMNFVDVGANYGLYTIVAAAKIGPGGRVVCVEPQSELRPILTENVTMNCLENNVIVKSCALGATRHDAFLFQPSRTNDGAAVLQLDASERSFKDGVPVTVETLENVLNDCQISDFQGMKIDVEGAELSVLQGAAAFLNRRQPEFILVECIDKQLERFDASSELLLSYLWEFDYRTACLYHGRWRAFSTYKDYLRWQSSPDVLAVQRNSLSWDIAQTLFC